MTVDPQPPATVTPAGPLLVDAAAWVGASCWAELRIHQALTGLLGTVEPDQAIALWAVRAHRGELAAAWHQRLPELGELPRAGFVEPTPDVATILARCPEPAAGDPIEAVAGVLSEMAGHYRARQALAVGPADGPTAATLRRAVADTDADIETLKALRSL